uniref:Uncharacterized protein n=1 Tax=Kryptolebias marmoratus TaxID=37003 RepID=A0A3Q3AWA1_KRYMA
MLQHMAHPDAATTNGYTPLHISAREGQVETASVLLEAGASPHTMAKNQMDIATVLLQYSADTNILTKQGVTPLHLASQEGHTDMAALLISKGAQINVPTKVTMSPNLQLIKLMMRLLKLMVEALK